MIRTTARAVIVRDQELLTIVYRSPEGLFYVLPGGGQQRGESLSETVRRECLEELGTHVEIERLLYVREFIPENHGFTDDYSRDHHGIDFMFACRISDEYAPQLGNDPDPNQTGVAWLPIQHLEAFTFYPAALKSALMQPRIDPYLGDIN